MSPFPTIPENERISTVHDGVHAFFNDSNVHPNNWTPLNFVNYPSANNYSDYTAGLAKLRRGGTSVVHIHASNITRWLKLEENAALVEQALLRLSEKVQAQNTELVTNVRRLQDIQHFSSSSYNLKRPHSPVCIICTLCILPEDSMVKLTSSLSFHSRQQARQALQRS
jgi:hypothetical protein